MMKKLLFLAFLTAVLFSCKDRKPAPGRPLQDTAGRIMPHPDSLVAPPYTWEVKPVGEHNRLILGKTPLASRSSLEEVLAKLNKKYDPLKMSVIRVSGDTVFVRLRPAKLLTQEMGSTGADVYMTEATLNLCEVQDIHFVNYNFAAGDHATPGTYSKNDFIDLYPAD